MITTKFDATMFFLQATFLNISSNSLNLLSDVTYQTALIFVLSEEFEINFRIVSDYCIPPNS